MRNLDAYSTYPRDALNEEWNTSDHRIVWDTRRSADARRRRDAPALARMAGLLPDVLDAPEK